jgi:regulator of RNase E activity RraA
MASVERRHGYLDPFDQGGAVTLDAGTRRRDQGLMDRLRRIDSSSLSDANKALRVLSSQIRSVTRGVRLLGRAITVDARGDLMSVLAGLEAGGPGDVLVVAAGSPDLAVAGELFATEAARRGMAGIVLDGLCRDSLTLGSLDLPVYARGTTPRAAPAQAVPVVQTRIAIGGVEVAPGDVLLGDDDGIVVADDSELEAAIDAAEAIQTREDVLRTAIIRGRSLFDALNFDEHRAALVAGRSSRLSFTD